MSAILVSGLINIETTLRVEKFPVDYSPARYPFFGVHSAVAGVGYNVARALTALGDPVRFLSLIGRDVAGEMARRSLEEDGLPGEGVVDALASTPQSVILYDAIG